MTSEAVMNTKVQVISLLLICGVVVWGGFARQDAAEQLMALEAKVATLQKALAEHPSEGLSRRVAKLEAQEGRAPSGGDLARRAKTSRPMDGSAAAPEIARAVKQDLQELKAALRDEVATMVESETDQARAAKREEKRARWREGAMHSVADFISDRGLDEDVGEKVGGYMERAIGDGMAMWAKVEAQEMSFYEFRKEMRKSRKAFEEEMSALLSEEDYAALIEAFPAKF